MNVLRIVEIIRKKFNRTGSPADVPLLKSGSFQATLMDEGVSVDNLGTQRFLN
jgi:hypothetical protein